MLPVSVVIPCYRCATTIERAIVSVDRQTQRPAEVILVDDASADATLGVLKAIQSQFGNWVRIIELPVNRGAASARNAGWNLASQPFVAFLDADDRWHREKLRVQFEYMRDNPDIIACGHRCLVLSNEKDLLKSVDSTFAVSPISPVSLIFKNAFSTPSVMLKRDIQFRFPEGQRYAEDVYLWQTIAFAGLRVVRIESPLAFTHKALYGAGGLSGNMWPMESGELGNFVALRRSGKISIWMMILASSFSLVKFVKRLLVQWLR